MTAEEEDVKPKLNIIVDFEGQTCTIKVKPMTAFRKVFEATEKRFGKEPGTFKFTYEGHRVRPEMTPADLNMGDGDTIDAHLEQQGGRICSRIG
ncbi:ubiquitin-like protein [Wolfiporia cocos MD-104 SS10]|uniref:Ubiquitin-like protein n=1 Tax=Wolfiporia cocos (strain MD-104) TaxID=742152 RepID=A0A2H3J7V8_WOLCO|nr:ubiquitin-like protein [Wolfiporia cocos MD-104 SS10]